MDHGVYVHVPYCLRKCSYCAFVSYAADVATTASSGYLEALLEEARHKCPDWTKEDSGWTLYVGGGTPTMLGTAALSKLLSSISGIMRDKGWPRPLEVSVEANPGTIDNMFASKLVESGVTRFSFGVQSMSDAELSAIGRSHSSSDAYDAVAAARAAGAASVSVDLMTGLPGQTEDSLRLTLESVMSLEPDHVSCYALTLEEGTPLFTAVAEGRAVLPSDDEQADLLELASSSLQDAGLFRYEISNYAKPGHKCRHNMLYWTDASYTGLGPAAHSYDRTSLTRSWNVADVYRYASLIASEGSALEGFERETLAQAMSDSIILSLRTSEGADLAAIQARFGMELPTDKLEAISWAEEQGILERGPDSIIRLTTRGIMLSNRLFTMLV